MFDMLCDFWAIFIVKLWKRYAQKLCSIILLQFKLIPQCPFEILVDHENICFIHIRFYLWLPCCQVSANGLPTDLRRTSIGLHQTSNRLVADRFPRSPALQVLQHGSVHSYLIKKWKLSQTPSEPLRNLVNHWSISSVNIWVCLEASPMPPPKILKNWQDVSQGFSGTRLF